MSHTFSPSDGIYAVLRVGEGVWETTRAHTYTGPFGAMTVPTGFVTDFASIPGWLLWLFNPSGKHQRAALWHDMAYRLQYCTRFEADALMRSIMTVDNVSRFKKMAIYLAVRTFGWIAWRKNARRVDFYRALAEEGRKCG